MSSPIAEEEGEMPEPHRAENINRKLLRSASSMSEDQIRAVSEEVAMTLVSRMVAHEQREGTDESSSEERRSLLEILNADGNTHGSLNFETFVPLVRHFLPVDAVSDARLAVLFHFMDKKQVGTISPAEFMSYISIAKEKRRAMDDELAAAKERAAAAPGKATRKRANSIMPTRTTPLGAKSTRRLLLPQNSMPMSRMRTADPRLEATTENSESQPDSPCAEAGYTSERSDDDLSDVEDCQQPIAELKLFCGSFNINGSVLSDEDAKCWLERGRNADVVVIGFQECNTPVPSTLPPSTHSYLDRPLIEDDYCVLGSVSHGGDETAQKKLRLTAEAMNAEHLATIRNCLSASLDLIADVSIGEPPTFTKVKLADGSETEWYGYIRMSVFVSRRYRAQYPDTVPTTFVVPAGSKQSACGAKYSKMRSPDKGAVGVHLSGVDILFLNMHLCGTNKYDVAESYFDAKRKKEMEIVHDTIAAAGMDALDTRRLVIMGDLNFRCELLSEPSQKKKGGEDWHAVIEALETEEAEGIRDLFRKGDRLRLLLMSPEAEKPKLIQGCTDALMAVFESDHPECGFKPTFTLPPGVQPEARRYGLKRTPSWCDRVLYRNIRPLHSTFFKVPQVVVSDHEAVGFSCRLGLSEESTAEMKQCTLPRCTEDAKAVLQRRMTRKKPALYAGRVSVTSSVLDCSTNGRKPTELVVVLIDGKLWCEDPRGSPPWRLLCQLESGQYEVSISQPAGHDRPCVSLQEVSSSDIKATLLPRDRVGLATWAGALEHAIASLADADADAAAGGPLPTEPPAPPGAKGAAYVGAAEWLQKYMEYKEKLRIVEATVHTAVQCLRN